MDMNHEARIALNRWRNRERNTERRAVSFNERMQIQLDALEARMIIHHYQLDDWQMQQVYYRDVGDYEPIDETWRTIHVGDMWGGDDVSAFFERHVTIPDTMHNQRVFLNIYIGGDSLLKLNGVPYHGLDPFRSKVLLSEKAQQGTQYHIELESYCFWFPEGGTRHKFSLAELITVDTDIEAFYWDLVAAIKLLYVRQIDESFKSFLERHIWDALKSIPFEITDTEQFKRVIADIRATLRQKVFETDRFKKDGMLHMVGHSHLDIVYRWTHREYIRKVGRTHATMLRLIEQYPDFKFSQSSAKIYADMKAYYPDLFEQVKQKIAEGSWQPVGAFWLEPDCNLISGESFVRHILHGQKFWQEEFGFTSRVCWQPDVFGMSWAMPQILKRSGIEVILTNKLYVWNDTNKWTQNDFWWEAPDGSRILAVIPPGHFIGYVDPDHMTTYWNNFSDKDEIGETIYIYGWGDGGGGVDPEMLECAVRYQDFPGIVPSQFNHPEDTLLHIADKAQDANLPIWRDELYLETHRGTYTSKGWLKKHNRQCEILLQQVEMLTALAWFNGADYSEAELDKAWKILLYTQFHDALPGTHITEVYHHLLDEYQCLYDIAHQIREKAAKALFSDAGDNLLIFNPSLMPRSNVVKFSADSFDDRTLKMPHQNVTNLDGTQSILMQLFEPIPATGYMVIPTSDVQKQSTNDTLKVTENSLENEYLRAEFSLNGELISFWDKDAEREVLVDGQHGNKFQLYQDRPGKFDAWDIVASYVEHELPMTGETSLTIDEQGDLRVSLKLVRKFYKSTITQRISLTAASRALTFETKVEWHERQRLLKVGFPVAINAHTATYDIAYGTIERATHRNTSHDKARFEVPAHWWMDMSEYDYGVALLNDSKYGHEANQNWMRLTLLKGSISPDPEADLGTHYFTYVLYPHLGDWREGDVISAATALNVPLYTRRTNLVPNWHSFIQCDAPNITIEAVKRSEDGKRLIIRLVERHNKRTKATLRFDKQISRVCSCDLMENEEQQLFHDSHTVQVNFKPREIVTITIE